MDFGFDINKATETACEFLKREGGSINIMKLVKLVYLLDRLSVSRRGIPVVGGAYFSLPNGPITSEFLDLINSGELWGQAGHWEEYIGGRQNHEIGLIQESGRENLSDSEITIIEMIHGEHGRKNQWELRDWCHEHCKEWTELERGRERITLEGMSRALGKTEEQIARITEEAGELRFLSTEFAG